MNQPMSRATSLLGAVLLVAPVMAFGATPVVTAGAATPTRVLTCTEKLTAKPSSYTLSCADANAGWVEMAWSTWGSSSARGRGVLRQNDCTPNCVSGKFLNYRATVTLSKVVATKRYGRLFSEATFHYTVSGKATTETFSLAD